MPRLIVDGNNVMGSRPDGWWRDRAAAARRLFDLISDSISEDVVVVFDGPSRFDAPSVVFSGDRSADDVIEEMAGEGDEVVTSDAELAARVRARGAGVVGAGAFRARLD